MFGQYRESFSIGKVQGCFVDERPADHIFIGRGRDRVETQ
jgi:hypothetical protein